MIYIFEPFTKQAFYLTIPSDMSGLFGVISKKDCVEDLFYGTDYQTHLGTERAGLAVMNSRIHRSIHNISTSQFKSKFVDEISQMKGHMGIGVISDFDPQPIIIYSSFGIFSLVTSGRLSNKEKLAREVIKQGGSFSELSNNQINSTEVVGKIIAQKENLIEGIKHLFTKIEGSLCILILTKEGIYAVRDPAGRTTLVIAKRFEGEVTVSSETCAFPNLGYKSVKELSAGEVVLITKKGNLEQKMKPSGEGKTCSFLWIYTGYPASSYEGINVETVREHCGANLAKDDINDALEADFVTGVPDSGTAHALGYAATAGIPYRRPLVKYTPGYGRSYTPPAQNIRDRVAKMKLIPIESVIRDQKIVVCDDSIVRGTQLKNQAIEKMWHFGAKEIHVRIACPPLMFPCPYLLSTRKNSELAARRAIKDLSLRDKDIQAFLDNKSPQYRRMVEKIRKELGVTTLKYQSVCDMVRAIGLTEKELCTFCWEGK